MLLGLLEFLCLLNLQKILILPFFICWQSYTKDKGRGDKILIFFLYFSINSLEFNLSRKAIKFKK
jgi:hypothetical protein